MTTVETPGLRERKRVATRRAIQLAVLRLASEEGLERVTVEEISRRADVSPRTFFNYFESREQAIAGDTPSLSEGSIVDAFINAGPGADLFAGISELVVAAAEGALEDHESLVLRRALHKKHPQLIALRIAGMRQLEDQLSDVISRRLTRDDPSLAAHPAALESRARLITFIAFGVLKHAWMTWADGDSGVPMTSTIVASFREAETLLVPATP
jgi:AcrR family transcriptional regulator